MKIFNIVGFTTLLCVFLTAGSSALLAADEGVLVEAKATEIKPVLPDIIEQGKVIAQKQCSHCHAIGKTGRSQNKKAPAFRTLHKKYPVDSLAESLAEGIMTGHNNMPEVTMTPEQITAFIAYLKSLES